MSAVHEAAVVRMWPRRITQHRPRLGFLGLGWIGRARMQALLDADVADVIAVADTDAALVRDASSCAHARACASLTELLRQRLDGIVIATPSALHSAQAITALESGAAVFCQKPLSRTAAEAESVVAAARTHDRLLGVDFSYRHVAGVAELRRLVRAGELGEVYAIDLTFHNAYGPDKAWFYDVAQSGGGCVMDLGVHLVDLAAWVTGCARAEAIDARLYRNGSRMASPIRFPEDYASVQYRLGNGASVRLACSWRMPAGADAVIEASFYGTRGGVSLHNVGGSFYDFRVARFDGTQRSTLAAPPDAWGGRALVAWARKLARGARFDPEVCGVVDVAAVLDGIYGR
ncbi:MAG TPA: Gfo/Idh/MocA family oxidoreductase [Rhodanobacteraceae bacterium]|jgi:predicted dehydrogenase|nr:Gfo/Idh/MocA family oxidoreductase [Rhodanobacteraceae bacterium]